MLFIFRNYKYKKIILKNIILNKNMIFSD